MKTKTEKQRHLTDTDEVGRIPKQNGYSLGLPQKISFDHHLITDFVQKVLQGSTVM